MTLFTKSFKIFYPIFTSSVVPPTTKLYFYGTLNVSTNTSLTCQKLDDSCQTNGVHNLLRLREQSSIFLNYFHICNSWNGKTPPIPNKLTCNRPPSPPACFTKCNICRLLQQIALQSGRPQVLDRRHRETEKNDYRYRDEEQEHRNRLRRCLEVLHRWLSWNQSVRETVGGLECFFELICCRGPVPVLVMSLLFIASVFMLHIWGKYTRS